MAAVPVPLGVGMWDPSADGAHPWDNGLTLC